MSTQIEEVVEQSRKLRPRTKALYLSAVQRFVSFAGKDPAGWTGIVVERFYAGLLEEGLAPQSANVILSGVRYASKRMHLLYGRPDFALAVEPARDKAPSKPRALTLEEAWKLLDACEGRMPIDLRDRAIVGLGLTTGMRRFSMTGIMLQDFDYDRKRERHFVAITLKGGDSHNVPLSGPAREFLAPWRSWLKRQGIERGPLLRSIVPNLDDKEIIGGALSTNALYKALVRRATKAGLEGVRPHVFRHTFITWAKVTLKVQNHEIAGVTGHHLPGATILDKEYTDKSMVGGEAADAVGKYLMSGRPG